MKTSTLYNVTLGAALVGLPCMAPSHALAQDLPGGLASADYGDCTGTVDVYIIEDRDLDTWEIKFHDFGTLAPNLAYAAIGIVENEFDDHDIFARCKREEPVQTANGFEFPFQFHYRISMHPNDPETRYDGWANFVPSQELDFTTTHACRVTLTFDREVPGIWRMMKNEARVKLDGSVFPLEPTYVSTPGSSIFIYDLPADASGTIRMWRQSYQWIEMSAPGPVFHESSERLVMRMEFSNPADLDDDGQVDGRDLAELLGEWGDNCWGCKADIDRDGRVTGADLAFLLGSWGKVFP